jgi:hypothetical protein
MERRKKKEMLIAAYSKHGLSTGSLYDNVKSTGGSSSTYRHRAMDDLKEGTPIYTSNYNTIAKHKTTITEDEGEDEIIT